MNYNRWIAVGALCSAVACGENNTNPTTDATVTDTTVTDSGSGGPSTCGPRAASGQPAAARALQARGFSEQSPTAVANYSVDFFLDGVVRSTCAAPNCITAMVDGQGNINPSLPPDLYAYRISDPAAGAARPGLTTYGFNRIPAGAGVDSVFQVSAGTRTLLTTAYQRTVAANSAAIAGGAVNAQGQPQTGASIRVFVNGTQVTSGAAMSDQFIGYFTGTPNAPTPNLSATSIGDNGRWAAANLVVGAAGATVRVEVVQGGTVVGCEEGSLFQNSVSLMNIGPLRSDYQSCSGCYQYRVTSDAGVTDAATSDASTSDATTSDASTSDASTSDASTSDATTTSDASTSDATVADTSTNG